MQSGSGRGDGQPEIYKYGQPEAGSFRNGAAGSQSISVLEKAKYDEEKMLIEQDPFLLEEQRYLNRMQRAHNIQEVNYKKHYDSVLAPEVNKKKQQDQYENQVIERRIQSLAEAQDRQRKMKTDLTKIHS